MTVNNKTEICRDLVRKTLLSVPPRPEPRTHCLLAPATLLNTPSSIPSGKLRFIPARFRVFANYDLGKWGVEGKEVLAGPVRAPLYQNYFGGFPGATIPHALGRRILHPFLMK